MLLNDFTITKTKTDPAREKYPIVTLQCAREKKLEAQRLLKRGTDPSVARKHAKATARTNSLSTVADEWLERGADTLRPAPSSYDSLIDGKEVCRRTGLGMTTIRKLMLAGTFPRRLKVTDKSTRWSANAVEAWIQDRIADSNRRTA